MVKRGTSIGTSGAGAKRKQPADAIEMLEADHRKVEKLFYEFLHGDDGQQPRLAQEIFQELEVHSTLEEELFYPALHSQGLELFSGSRDEDAANGKAVLADEEQVGDGVDADIYSAEDADEQAEDNETDLSEDTITSVYDDHRMVRDQIARLRQMDTSAPEFRHNMVELQDMVADHVSTEEEELFPEAQISLDLAMLGQQMRERKADILSEAA